MIAVPFDANLEDIKALITKHNHSRMPIYKNNFDQIIGFIHTKDLARFLSKNSEEFEKLAQKLMH